MEKTKAVFAIGIVLAVLAVFIAPAAAGNYFYFVPQNSSCGVNETVLVSAMIHFESSNNGTPLGSAQAHIDFDPSVVNITNIVEPIGKNDWDVWNWEHMGNYVYFGGNEFGGFGFGEIYLGNMTLKGINPGVSPLEYTHFYPQTPDPTNIGNTSGDPVSFSAINGTFKCADLQQCLGTCCNDAACSEPYATDMTCKECLDLENKYWHPNKDAACFDGASMPDLYLNYCPDCTDGVDNDDDGNTDFPSDVECTCGLDPSEVDPLPPIPELPTILLFSMGLLVLTGYVAVRKKDGAS
jgi:hypothetical protein